MTDRWRLSRKTLCTICQKPIQTASYSCPKPDHTPVHFACRYAEMAVTNGDTERAHA